MSHLSCLTFHVSLFMSHLSCLTFHVSPFMSHLSSPLIAPSNSCWLMDVVLNQYSLLRLSYNCSPVLTLTTHASILTSHVSTLTGHGSDLISHISALTSHLSFLTSFQAYSKSAPPGSVFISRRAAVSLTRVGSFFHNTVLTIHLSLHISRFQYLMFHFSPTPLFGFSAYVFNSQ